MADKSPPSFNKSYFDNKTGEALRKTITPNWESTSSHLSLLKVPTSADRVLEIGCGIGRLLREIHDEKNGRHCVGYDASAAMIAEGQEYTKDRNVELIKCDGSGTDLVGQYVSYFDFAFSIVVFQHIPHTHTVKNYIAAMAQMLKPGGSIKFQVLTEDYNKGHLWSYHPLDELSQHLSELGFESITREGKSRWTVFSAVKSAKGKKQILFIGPLAKGTDEIWGGSVATSYNYFRSMELSEKYNVIALDRRLIKTPEDVKKILADYPYDVLHVDDAGTLQYFYKADVLPDVIGPISRAPKGVKTYTSKKGVWDSVYTADWFYKSIVVRLNANEERSSEYADRYVSISQGVDTQSLRPPAADSPKKYVIWAGDSKRPAKNFALFEEVKKITQLPEPYEFKILSGYKVSDYWKILDEVAILVNTSRYESFCAALYEAKAKGVPTIYRKKLHNDRFPDGQIQVEYNAKGYRDAILSLLSDPERLKLEGQRSREYCVDNASFFVMKNSYELVYDSALAKKAETSLTTSL